MASTKLTRTPSSQGNTKKWTYSMWVKLSGINTEYVLFHNYGSNTSREVYAKIGNNNGTIEFALNYDGSFDGRLITNRLFRDPNAWYHFVFVCDTENSTSGDRLKIYVNGVRETSFSTETYPTQNAGTVFNTTHEHTIGSYGSGNYFDGIMSHIHMADGQAYDASTFGSTDSTTGEWKITTSPSVTYGTNGFFILKDGNSVTDQSGNSNNYAVGGGTLINTEDCPSNVFANLNPLSRQVAAQLASSPTNGSTTLTSGSGSAWGTLLSTIGASSGKYYCEAKLITLGSYARLGICDMSVSQQNSADTWFVGQTSGSAQYGYNSGNGNLYTNAGDSAYGNSFTAGDIIGIAMDLDNSKLYFHKNGTYQNSGVPTSGSTGTGATSITADKTYGFAISGYASTVWNVNFGNGYFGTTAISSEGTNASGIGKFEYDVPTGYTALSTKGLNE